LNASDVSLIQQYNASIKDLCNIYAVPVQLLNNTESATYNNMKEAKKALYQNCVIPELNKIRDELNRWLVPKFGEKLFIDFDYSAIPELQEENEKVVDQLAKAWWVTPNEKRSVMNYGVDDENTALDNYYIPANLLPIETNEMPIPDPIDEVDIEQEKQLIKEAIRNIQVNSDVFDTKAEVEGMPDVYTTEDEAIARAIELGGDGYHEHEFDGEVVYMPFETHQEYEDAIAVMEESKAEMFDDYPQTATNNAKRMIEWREKYGRDVVKGGTEVGWQRANQLAKREAISADVVSRMAQFNRHRENAKIADEYKDEPWKDRGYVAWNLWGGTAGVDWAIKKMEELRNG
jgi:hypothetical protein